MVNYDVCAEGLLESKSGILITITTDIAREAKTLFADAEWVKSIPDYALIRGEDEITVYYEDLDESSVDWILQRLLEQHNIALATTVANLKAASLDPTAVEFKDLVVFAQALGQYIKRDAIDGWIYLQTAEGDVLPYFVVDVDYREAANSPPFVVITLTANSIPTRNDDLLRPPSRNAYIFAEDLQNRRLTEILALKGLMKETPELRQQYLASVERFGQVMPRMNEQFWATDSGLEVDMTQNIRHPEKILFDAPCRVINDEGLLNRKFFTQVNSPFWDDVPGGPYDKLPVHPLVLCFNLDTHTNMWIHVDRMTPYQYDASLREKLVLPEEHRDLIDILTQDMDILMDDIVAGKSGGTTILCMGAPGLGKTLTAEVYSEVVARPLYRVHSGQLGVSAESVEKNLEKVLKRAQRWGAIMLIDEADVYIRRRGNEIDHNAVVASFLRTLEYFHGLLFLTTNRVNDVDDAISSRCIATIKYIAPDRNSSKRIWRVLSDQFQFELSDVLIEELVDYFQGISGRDIKELLKLTAKWCRQKRIDPSLAIFRTCAQFRGI